MLKVFLVEDEVIVREGIRDNIDWNSAGLDFCGEASDGELALPMIRQEKPDILITDIKMPFVDGLALSRMVKAEMPWVKIIILSGYDEFQYAKEAIGIGVTEYILKPVSGAKLLETVKNVQAQIEREQEQQTFSTQFHKEMSEFENFQKKQLFIDLISKKLSVPELLDRARRLDIELSAQTYNVILFTCYIDQENPEQYSERIIELNERIEDVFSNRHHMLLFRRELSGWAVLSKGSLHEPADAVTRRCINELVSVIEEWPEISYFIGAGTPVNRLSDISKSFSTASRAFSHRYTMEKNQAVFYDDLPTRNFSQDDHLSIKGIDAAKLHNDNVDHFLRSGLKETIADFVESTTQSYGSEMMASETFRQYLAIQVFLNAAIFLTDLGIDKENLIEMCGDLNRVSSVISDLEDTRLYVMDVLNAALTLRDSFSSQHYRDLMTNAQNYIKKNYSSEDFSLNEVARAVNVSPTYFSVIFSQEMGLTFTEYLTNVRMEKAQELLRCTSMKSSEIGYAIGYKNAHYFSFIFKKLTGMTPREYRSSAEETG